MNYQNYPGGIIDVDYVEVSPAPYSMGTSLLPWHASAKMKRVIKEAMVQRTHDQCLALLAKAGLEHTAALSKMEQEFTSMAPQSLERYRVIVDAYAQQTVERVRRW